MGRVQANRAQTVEPITMEGLEGLLALATARWLDDCGRNGWSPDRPSAHRSVVGPLIVELWSVTRHLATYRYSLDSDGAVCLRRVTPTP